jgi:DNA adenine methylase
MTNPPSPSAKVTALAPWFGSKRTLAARIVAELGEHRAYWEPFCGGMAVLLAKPPCRHEIVNDLNRDLVNVARVLQSRATATLLLERLHFTLAAEETFHEAHSNIDGPYTGPLGDVERAYWALVRWWLGRNGMAGTTVGRTGFCLRYSSEGGSGGVRWRSLVESVPAFMERLARVDVLNRDGFELLGKIADKPGTAIYCDPPYLVKSARYEHDFAAADHERLATAVARFTQSRVVVSYYDHPDLDRLYPPERWRKVAFAVNRAMGHSAGKPGQATEVLLVNRPA